VSSQLRRPAEGGRVPVHHLNREVSNLQPFASSGAKNSLIPSMVSVDPQNNRIYVTDAGAGKLAGVNLQNGKLSVAWTQDQTTLSFTTLIGPRARHECSHGRHELGLGRAYWPGWSAVVVGGRHTTRSSCPRRGSRHRL
jgi:hypothetical protein